MIARKHRLHAGAVGALLSSALLAVTAYAQDRPTTPPATTGTRSVTIQRECRQMAEVERQNCEQRLRSTPEQTDPNSINSTTRSAPSSSASDSTKHPPPKSPTQDETPGPSSKDASERGPDARTKPQPSDDDEEHENAAPESPPPQPPPQPPPPDTTSEANNPSDTQDPPHQR